MAKVVRKFQSLHRRYMPLSIKDYWIFQMEELIWKTLTTLNFFESVHKIISVKVHLIIHT